jgi:hypothetical protein
MKLTKSALQNIINEELAAIQEEQEAAAIMHEIENWGRNLDEVDAGTLEKGAKMASRAGDFLSAITKSKAGTKAFGAMLKKLTGGDFLADLLADATPEDIEGLRAVGAAARGQLDRFAKTVAEPIEETDSTVEE